MSIENTSLLIIAATLCIILIATVGGIALTFFLVRMIRKNLQPGVTAVQLGRVPMPGGAWRFSGPFWEYAKGFKKQMEIVYGKMAEKGVLALDPDKAPPGVPLRMELSTVAQGFLPHLSAEDADRIASPYCGTENRRV